MAQSHLHLNHLILCCIYFCTLLNNHVITAADKSEPDKQQKQTSLEVINDHDLVDGLKEQQYVVVLFSKKNCAECDKLEEALIKVKDELEDYLSSVWMVKVVSSPMKKLYSPDKEPVLVFFRHGIPLLYDGPVNEEEMFNTFVENKEPIVKELNDDTFEHLTQVSSGATTGDWFIMFYDTKCVDCLRLTARWEAVGAKLKQRVVVATVNKDTTGVSTARRLNVNETPAFIFFRQGKMYRYQIPKYDISSLVSFAKEWYRNAHAEKVPVPQSPFDDITQTIADVLRGNPWIMKLGSICICVVVIVTTASKLFRKSEVPSQKKDK